MIKLTILYPNTEGKKFDKEYYIQTHMPLSVQLQGSALKGVNVDFGVSGLPGQKAPYVAICHFLYDSLEDFQKAFLPHSDVLRNDILNYTDIETIIQFSEVKI